MGIVYDSAEYALSRLKNTFIFYDNKVIEVVDNEGDMIIAKDTTTNKKVEVDYKELVIEPVKLGYVNVTNGVVHVARVPKRRDYRQGLSHNVLNIKVVGDAHIRYFNYAWLKGPILGKYPKFKTCLANVSSKKRSSQAFSREFCLVSKMGLVAVVYKGYETIGTVEGGCIKLYHEYHYLKERLSKYEH